VLAVVLVDSLRILTKMLEVLAGQVVEDVAQAQRVDPVLLL
jgi:hypothetical protein